MCCVPFAICATPGSTHSQRRLTGLRPLNRSTSTREIYTGLGLASYA